MLTVDGGGGVDVVAVYGSQGADSFVVSDVAVSVLGQTVAVVVEAVEVGRAGWGGCLYGDGRCGAPIAVVGGDPIGVSAGDRLVLAGPGGRWSRAWAECDSGAFVVAGTERVSFRQLEAATVLPGFGPVVSGGTSGADVTIVDCPRQPSPMPVLTDCRTLPLRSTRGGNFWLDVASVAVQAGSGDDQVVLLAPAPNAAVWNVAAGVDGGASRRAVTCGGGYSGFDRHGALPADGFQAVC